MRKIFIVISLVVVPFFLQGASVVIIGGGPIGLATAIEAKQSGFDVTVIEKRKEYSRWQVVFLLDSSLKLLEKWDVKIPGMRVLDLEDNQKMSFVQINTLEKSLQRRALESGVIVN